jgi:hypothetical protein
MGIAMEHNMSTWKITGSQHGKIKTVDVQAKDYNEAVRKGSHHPHMFVVRDVVLISGQSK